MNSIKYLWRVFSAAKLAILASLFILSMGFNLLIASGGIAFRIASSAYEAVTGSRSVASRHADELAELSADLAGERRLKRELSGEVAELSAGITGERRLNRKLRNEILELGAQAALQKVAVENTAEAISSRAKTTATRGAKAMIPKAVPYFGTAVIVGVTAMELKDLCQTIRDMNALKRVFEPGEEADAREVSVCSMRVPTRQELWVAAQDSPAQAWQAVAELTPTLEELRSIEIPDINWAEYWATTTKNAEGWWAYSADGAVQSWEVVKSWWNSDY